MSGIGAVQARMAEIQTRLVAMNPAPRGAAFDSAFGDALAAQALTQQAASAPAATALPATASIDGATTTLAAQQGRALAGPTGAGTTATGGGRTGADLVQAATKYLGVPYVWGGESLSEGGLDCSGLVQLAFSDLGVDVPRVARQQMTIGTEVPSLAQARPGDLIVQRGGAHIGIYVGDGQMLHAPYPGQKVKISDIATTPTTIRRVLPTDAAPTVDPARLALELAAGANR